MSSSRTSGPPSISELVLALYTSPRSVEPEPFDNDVQGFSAPFPIVKEHKVQTYLIDSAIHRKLAQVGTCSLDELAALLPGSSWAQVFSAVDRLTREGTVILTHPDPSHYLLSLAPRQPAEARHMMPV